jgi:hypothetical protein
MSLEPANLARNPAEWFRRNALLIALFAAPVSTVLNSHLLNDPDIWFHLRIGQWIMQDGRMPMTDPFSAFGAGKPWIAYSWLFDVLVYRLYSAFNFLGIVFLQLGLSLAIGFALYRMVARLQPSFLKSVTITSAGLFAMAPLFSPRPWLFTILFFVIELDLVVRARISGDYKRLLWLLPIFCLWANLHIQFLYGLFLLGIALVDAASEPLFKTISTGTGAHGRRALQLSAITAMCTLATLINPYHLNIYGVIYDYARETGVFQYVAELQALSFRDYSSYLVLLLALGAAFAVGWRRQLALFPVFLLLAGAFLSFRAARDCWFIVIAATMLIASASDAAPRDYHVSKPQWVLVAAGVIAILFGVGRVRHVSNATITSAIAGEFPSRATEIIEQRGYPGPLFNTFNWGGYLMWRLPRLPVSMDGRTNVYGEEKIARSVATWSGVPGWNSDRDLLEARIIVAPREEPLCSLLRLSPRYALVYEDEVAAVFIVKQQPHE